jgi:hypothetical protein
MDAMQAAPVPSVQNWNAYLDIIRECRVNEVEEVRQTSIGTNGTPQEQLQPDEEGVSCALAALFLRALPLGARG